LKAERIHDTTNNVKKKSTLQLAARTIVEKRLSPRMDLTLDLIPHQKSVASQVKK
jgi:hypothetical protein